MATISPARRPSWRGACFAAGMVIYFTMKRYVLVAAHAGRAIASLLAEKLEQPAITHVRLDVMLLLRDGPLLQRDLSIAFCVCPSVMSRIVTALEKVGYLSRTKLPSDRRQRIVTITREGLAVLAHFDTEGDSDGESLQQDSEDSVREDWGALLEANHVEAPRLAYEDSSALIFEMLPTTRRRRRRSFVFGAFEALRAPPMSPRELERIVRAA